METGKIRKSEEQRLILELDNNIANDIGNVG
jgi:hypothetical protein